MNPFRAISLCTTACLALAARTTLHAADSPSPTSSVQAALWPEPPLAKIQRSVRPASTASTTLELSAAGRETTSGQVVFLPGTNVTAARASVSAFRQRGSSITLTNVTVQLQWVRYIDITRNSDIPADERVAQAPASIPDPFWEDPAIPVKAGEAQPLWVEVQVPDGTPPGEYDAQLTIHADAASYSLPTTLRVWKFSLPVQQRLSVVNWWRFPGTGFETHGPNDWDLLRRLAQFLVAHRQTDLQTEISRITESGDGSGGYSHDTANLERYAEVAFAAGIRQIHLHSVGQRTGAILDPLTRVEPNEPNLRRLAAWEKVIQQRGWKRRFVTSIVDEPFVYYEDSYAAVVDRVHAAAPSVRCLEAVEAEYLGKLDVYVPKLSHLAMWYPRFAELQREGTELWFYVCCHPLGRYPNRFLDQTLVSARVLFWIHYLYNLDGYLHWGLNHYAGDPYTQEGISQDLPLGDRAVVYPGKEGFLGSLRFSAQRDGIQDYEYLRTLEDRLRHLKERIGAAAFWLDPRQRPLELTRRVLWSFHDYARDPQQLLATRRVVAEEIETLEAEPLLLVQTSPPEGSVVPAGPRAVNLRGLTSPGARVLVNGKPLNNVRPNGYFTQAVFLGDEQPVIQITAEHGSLKRTTVRSFRLTD